MSEELTHEERVKELEKKVLNLENNVRALIDLQASANESLKFLLGVAENNGIMIEELLKARKP